MIGNFRPAALRYDRAELAKTEINLTVTVQGQLVGRKTMQARLGSRRACQGRRTGSSPMAVT